MKHPQNYPSKYEKYFVSNIDYCKNEVKNKIAVSLELLYSFEAKKMHRLLEDERPYIVHINSIYHQISPSIIHS